MEKKNRFKYFVADFDQEPEDFNDQFSFIDDDGDRYQLVTKQEVLHAEHNLIAKLAQSNESSKGAVIFCTVSPCIECAKLIYQSGINCVYYGENYRDDSGIKFLQKSGVKIEQLDT